MNNQITNEQKIDRLNSGIWNSRYKDPSLAKKEASGILIMAKKARYRKGMAYASLNIAISSFLQSKNDVALKSLSEALSWFSENTSEPGYPRSLNLKSSLFESFGDYENALRLCLESLKLAGGLNDTECEAEACSQLGLIYTRLSDFQQALAYYQKGLEIRKRMKDENALASSLNRIGMIMRLIGRFDDSLEYYQKSLEIRRRNNQVTSIPWTMLGIASTYEEMKDYEKALRYYEQGLAGGDKRCSQQCLMGSGRILSLLGKNDEAEKRLKKSLGIAKNLKAVALIADACYALANHFESTGQPGKALINYKLFQDAKESVQSNESHNRLRNIEISHAIEKSENEKEIYRLRHVELKKAYDIIDNINRDITANINYASRIQQALLPDLKNMRNMRRNIFTLYLPKDIVSGDFYWFSRKKDKLIIAAVDCTGHGVPGALMSMLGISFLEEIVNLKGITDTADICNELREMVVRALRQKGEREEAKDGMDISICSYDKKQNVVEFTGANNNIYLIRNNELIEYRADRLPIGFSDELDKPYSRQLIKIVPGDIIYMFSDGFADQFGGPDNKRYKYSGLKAILLQVSNKPLDEQKTLLENEFSSWKEERQQTDDILIIGFKP